MLYYLRSVKVCEWRASARRRPHAAARGVVVEYMDRARGPTVDIFPQTLPGTLSTTAKLSYLTHFFMRDTCMSDHKRTRKSLIRGLSLQHQLPRDVAQAGRSKTRTVKGVPACKQRMHTLSCKSRAATVAGQRESHHGDCHGCFLSVDVSQLFEWNVPQARTSMAS